ncbi:MAG: cellobiose phosphorylase [Candidatus Omnitrophica bacterium]|nr:cellobiose phosphorylase [Candidatus Omnitrophota bacterium]
MKTKTSENKPSYSLKPSGEFVIENYNRSKPFASFFPGIAGKYGIPMWTFYVNRAQGICSFGVRDKDHSILEFQPANKAWRTVSYLGFRTFIKAISGKKLEYYEPFHNSALNAGFKKANRMRISPDGLSLEEENLTLGLSVKVKYFNIPNETYAGLARIITIKNIGRSSKKIQFIDGLPQIVPYGTSNWFLKEMSRTIEAWMTVDNLKKGVPFYRLYVDPQDRPEVVHINEGHFYLPFSFEKGKAKIPTPIVDPQDIFGPVTDLSYPSTFLGKADFKNPVMDNVSSRTPSAFSLTTWELRPQEEKTLYSVIGHMRNVEILNSSIPRIIEADYLSTKEKENSKLISELQRDIETSSSSGAFDLYSKQTYLDNILRGGYPILLNKDTIFHLYSRKHGDLERDYNRFSTQPAYFSQGNGNYRDVNQNRRLDAWFNPEVKEENLISLLNLIQIDGFNPLIIKGATFSLKNPNGTKQLLCRLVDDKDIDTLASFLSKSFTPGETILFVQDKKIALKVGYDEFISILIEHSDKNHEAEHGEGFWIDHWTYNLDSIESYLGLYPEKRKELFFEKKAFTYFENAEVVKPRSEKYVLHNGQPRQLHSVILDHPKRDMIHARRSFPHLSRDNHGLGEIYRVNLINKLLCLFANKMASLDPFGVGVEMEANKPNWFDSLNGLPALFGSSLCETFEVKRLAITIKNALSYSEAENIGLTEEVYQLLLGLNGLIQQYRDSSEGSKDFDFWNKSACLKEDYRNKTKMGFSGKETAVNVNELTAMLDSAISKIDSGIQKAFDKTKNVYYGYFIHEVAEYDLIKGAYVSPKRFIQRRLPLFLEGQVHALRLAQDKVEALKIHKGTKKSELYDKSLKMYKVTASLKDMPEEIGRCRVFTPGWLENESIWLHMEYKYLLELLKQGLYEDFYAEFKNVLVPFQKPEKYGRNILENSSFIVSSAFPDKNLHGNGFVARLSGSTAEFLEIWKVMNCGKAPFFLNEKGELNLRFEPNLAGWLFNKKGEYSFNFLSKVKVVYHNQKKKDTFGRNAARIKKVCFNDKDGVPVEISSNVIASPYALQVRERQIKQIDIYTFAATKPRPSGRR